MHRHTFRVAAVTTALLFLIVVLSAVQMSGGQSSGLLPLDANGPITYFIADGSANPDYRPSDRQLARWALQAWQRAAGKRLSFVAAPESKAFVRLYWAKPSVGEYGEMQPLTVGSQRGAAVFIRPDVESMGQAVAERAQKGGLLRDSIIYLTCLHEFGHALGLEHTQDFRDIMYSFQYGGNVVEYFGRYRAQLRSRSDIATVSGLSDADVRRIKALYSRK